MLKADDIAITRHTYDGEIVIEKASGVVYMRHQARMPARMRIRHIFRMQSEVVEGKKDGRAPVLDLPTPHFCHPLPSSLWLPGRASRSATGRGR
jgi:hypothetical protein